MAILKTKLIYHELQARTVDLTELDIVRVEGDDFVHDFSLELSNQRFLRAELRGYRGRPERGEVVVAMTNPIYLTTRSQE